MSLRRILGLATATSALASRVPFAAERVRGAIASNIANAVIVDALQGNPPQLS